MKITLLEPFFAGSHRQWARGFQQHFPHPVEILSLPGRHWKWRMHGGAVSLANQFMALKELPDVIMATSMVDLTTFLALTRERSDGIPVGVYFHENQITYPWSPDDPDPKLRRDNHYGFINFTSALAADRIFFNSAYHLESFINSLPRFLGQFPDFNLLESVESIRAKSQVLYLGMDLKKLDAYRENIQNEIPVILWNHRWEYDKNPEAFYRALCDLRDSGIAFQLVLLGESYESSPAVFQTIKETFKEVILHTGYAADFSDYAYWLWRSDILLVTSRQDFFGGSVVEAIYCACTPLLPDRLAYPEHIPISLRNQYLYKDDVDLSTKLKRLLKPAELNTDRQKLSNFVARYDWSILVEDYVESLGSIRRRRDTGPANNKK